MAPAALLAMFAFYSTCGSVNVSTFGPKLDRYKLDRDNVKTSE